MAGNPHSLALDRLRRSAAAMAPEERPPELCALMRAMEGMEEAEELLEQARKHLGPTPPSLEHPRAEERRNADQASAELLLGLLHVLEAACAGFVTNMHSLSPRLQTLLIDLGLLFPTLFVSPDNRRKVGRPRAGSARIPPVEAVKQLAAAFMIHIQQREYNDWQELPPLCLADAALEAFWPGCGLTRLSEGSDAPEAQRARCLLASREWVPQLPGETGGVGGNGSGGAGGAASAAAAAAAAAGRAAAGEEGQAEAVAPLTLSAVALQDILGQLSAREGGERVPSLQDVRRWVLLLWLELGGEALQSEAAGAPPTRRFLLGIQLALSSGLLGELESAKLALLGAEVAAGNTQTTAGGSTPHARRVTELMASAQARAEAARAWQEACRLARHLCNQLVLEAGAAQGAERAAALERAQQAMERAGACLANAKPWLPAALAKRMGAQHREARQNFEACRGQLQRQPADTSFVGEWQAPPGAGLGWAGLGWAVQGYMATGFATTVVSVPGFQMPRCDQCGSPAPHLRRCSACGSVRYCSKECQVVGWKHGAHKAECAALAAARGARA